MNRAHRLTTALGGIALALGGVLITAPSAHADDRSPLIVPGEITSLAQNPSADNPLCNANAFAGLINIGCSPISL